MSGRWSNEAQVLVELEAMADRSWALVGEYKAQAVNAANAEALHKSLRAKAVLRTAATPVDGRRPSIALAEASADADDAVVDALQNRLVTAALADATREALRSIRTNQDALRTAAASHRQTSIGPGYQ